ncbi:hypothetical protein AGMMS49574_06900 [Bacteroidia bacterium]|nr:hypothetical protein AGMMS49574_06900 [Bacteroidia bacterium]
MKPYFHIQRFWLSCMFLLVFEAAAYSQSTYPVQAFDTVYGNNPLNSTCQCISDIHSSEERAAFTVNYNINPNIKVVSVRN